MWTSENRGRYDRSKLRYPTDLIDEEWALVAPLIAPAKRGGNKRSVGLREVVNGLPQGSTVHGSLDLWDDDGTLKRLHHALYVACREKVGREASPTAAIIDSHPSVSSG